MNQTGYYTIIDDKTVFKNIYYTIGYVDRELFIIAMILNNFEYKISEKEIYFKVKYNPKMNRINNTIKRLNKNLEKKKEMLDILSLYNHTVCDL
jgi:predicted RNase H-like nuclease (RuvC/YqgF family)